MSIRRLDPSLAKSHDHVEGARKWDDSQSDERNRQMTIAECADQDANNHGDSKTPVPLGAPHLLLRCRRSVRIRHWLDHFANRTEQGRSDPAADPSQSRRSETLMNCRPTRLILSAHKSPAGEPSGGRA